MLKILLRPLIIAIIVLNGLLWYLRDLYYIHKMNSLLKMYPNGFVCGKLFYSPSGEIQDENIPVDTPVLPSKSLPDMRGKLEAFANGFQGQ
jgi:hypothetical protein